MGTETERSRCGERITALSKSGADSRELRLEAIGLLRRAIGFDRWCWPTADPAAALHLTGIGELDNWQALPRMILLEQTHDPFNAMPNLAQGPQRSRRPTSALDESWFTPDPTEISRSGVTSGGATDTPHGRDIR